MPSQDIRCVLVKIHGIGNQKRTWSSRFDAMLQKRLETLSQAQRSRFASESVWWADVSKVPGLGAPAAVPAPAVAGSLSTGAKVTYTLVQNEYMSYLEGAGATTPGAPAGLGLPNPLRVIAKLKDVTVRAVDGANDVANYVSNNGVRVQMQHRLSDKLFQVQAAHPKAKVILGTHSQGTIIAYDVLRLNGAQIANLATWVTMGSPLGWYLRFLRWGDEILGMQPSLTWLNFYDDEDKVGQGITDLVAWPSPKPRDIDVDNRAKGLDAHDHWHNSDVVARYFQLIRQHL